MLAKLRRDQRRRDTGAGRHRPRLRRRPERAPAPSRRRLGPVPSASALVAAGAAVEYLLDPQQGRGRRARLVDQARAAVRRRRRDAERAARYAEGRLEGAAARAQGAGTFTPADDRSVAAKLKEVLAAAEPDTTDVTVDVVAGVATLRGQVTRPDQIDELVRACGQVNGVERVESYLHLPGAPAPNKARSRQADGSGTGDVVHHGA